MGELVSPNQVGNKGDMGAKDTSPAGGKVISPTQVGNKGNNPGGEASSPGGKLISTSGAQNAAEANGHGAGRGSKGNDAPKNRAWMS